MKKFILILVSIFLSACATSDYVKSLKVNLSYDYDMHVQFIDADSNEVFDYMNNKLVLKDETPQHEWKTKQIKYKINKDSSQLTEKEITKYLREKSYSAEFIGVVNDTITPPNLSGTIAISNLDDNTKYYCEILFEDNENVEIVAPASAEPFNFDAESVGVFNKLAEDIGKPISEITDEDWEINISMASDNNSINIHFGDAIAAILETVEMFDIKGDKVYSQRMNKQKSLNIPTVSYKNGSYVVRFTGREPWNKYPEDRVVIISR